MVCGPVERLNLNRRFPGASNSDFHGFQRDSVHKGRMRRLFALLCLLLPAVGNAHPSVDASASLFCEVAIAGAERSAGLPVRMMMAIAMTESGRLDTASGRIRPWPWTINAEGTGQYFASRDQAVAAVRAMRAAGVRSIDVGCMQVNLMHHPSAFASIEDAFDPAANAAYAARFLTALFTTHGHWHKAIGAYHSLTPARGNAYLDLVLARWQGPNLTVMADRSAYQAFSRPAQPAIYGAFANPGGSYTAFPTVRR